MKEQRLDEEQADVFVSAWALIRGRADTSSY